MAAITATDWTVSFTKQTIQNNIRMNLITLAMGATTGTYPTNGLPLPAGGALGLPRAQVQSLLIREFTATNAGRIHQYDSTNHTIRAFVASTGAEVATTVTAGAGAPNLYIEVWGS